MNISACVFGHYPRCSQGPVQGCLGDEQNHGYFYGRELGEARLYLGMTIECNRQARTLKLGQGRAVMQLLAKFGRSDAKSLTVPLNIAVKLTKDGGSLMDKAQYPYSQLVWKFIESVQLHKARQ